MPQLFSRRHPHQATNGCTLDKRSSKEVKICALEGTSFTQLSTFPHVQDLDSCQLLFARLTAYGYGCIATTFL
jgi:hypothetical protein